LIAESFNAADVELSLEAYMFRRKWVWFGKLVSDEGFTLAYGNKSITYTDERGSFQFGLEDGLLFTPPMRIGGKSPELDQCELGEVVDRVIRGVKFEGHAVEVQQTQPSQGI
jgi:hypothetical protein